jgi:hypothetical protein
MVRYAKPVRTRVRCNARRNGRACDTRRTLAMHPTWYKFGPPPCRKCGATNYRVDNHRMKHGRGGTRNETCRCPNYFGKNGAFPHRKGFGACEHNPHLTEEDFYAIQASMRNRRLHPL